MAVRESGIVIGLEDEDRTGVYREWRFGFGGGMYVLDVDQIEWRKSPRGTIEPVVLIELKRFDTNAPVETRWLDKTLRNVERRFQGEACRRVAAALGVPAWLVVFRHDLTGFWVYNLTDRRGWFPADDDGHGFSEYQYRAWLEEMAAT